MWKFWSLKVYVLWNFMIRISQGWNSSFLRQNSLIFLFLDTEEETKAKLINLKQVIKLYDKNLGKTCQEKSIYKLIRVLKKINDYHKQDSNSKGLTTFTNIYKKEPRSITRTFEKTNMATPTSLMNTQLVKAILQNSNLEV